MRVSQGRKRQANRAHGGKQPDPQGLSGRQESPHPFDLVTAPASSALGLTPPFPKQGSLSAPLETSLQSRGWHWFLSPKFVLWEVKPYSPRVNTEVQGIGSQDKMLRPCPHPGRIIDSGRTLTLDSRSFYSHPLQSLRLHLQHFTQVLSIAK